MLPWPATYSRPFMEMRKCRPFSNPTTNQASNAHPRNPLPALQLLHRDIKPANVLVDTRTGVVRLCDFGFARPCNSSAKEVRGERAACMHVACVSVYANEQACACMLHLCLLEQGARAPASPANAA
mgnify:CR=1 FL=1